MSKNWIQKATKNMRKDKPCTGEKFGSESCPPGSKRYNLAKTFRKMAKEGHKLASLERASVLSASDDPKDQDKAREIRVRHDYENLKKQIGSKKKPTKPAVNEGDVHSGQGEKIQKRTKAWMDKKGMKGAPGLDAMKARTAEHKAKRGVKEEVVDEAKVEKGRSDYGKATIRNWRHSGPSTVEPAMFDPENKGGKTIEKRREEHKARRGVKGAKVPTYKKEEVEVQEKVLDKFETGEKERIVKGMKKDTKGFKKRYGDKWKNVMYATATKKAKEAGDTSKSDKRYAHEGYQRDPEQSKKDRTHSKQPDPSKDGFTGIGNMSIKDIMRMNARMKKEKKKEVKEDKALAMVKAAIIKKHGKGAIYDPKNPPKPPTEAQKKKAAAERKKRQDADNKAYAARAKKAGFKSTQDYTNVVARYGSEDNYRKGKGLGT